MAKEEKIKKEPKTIVKKAPQKVKPKTEHEAKVEISPILREDTPLEIIHEFKKPKFDFSFMNIIHQYKTYEMVFIILLTFIIGGCIGGLTVSLNAKEEKVTNIIGATTDTAFNKLVDTYNYLIENYIEDVDKDTLINGALDGMVEAVGDPYTSYFDTTETSNFYKRLVGTFHGIGCEIVSDGTDIYISGILANSPAEVVKLQAGDIISKVNSTSVKGLTANETVNIIGEADDDIVLTIIRDEKTKTVEITKADVTIESVHSDTYTKNGKTIGYIQIDIFAQNTYEQFRTALTTLEKKNIDSLVIDVRDNSGGYLDKVASIASLFLDDSKVIYQLKTATETTKLYSTGTATKDYPIAVLQNSNSASGSEILAAVIKETYHGEVIGTNSYGKSSVQETADLGDGTMIKFTVKRWLTPNGNDVGGLGLEPTIKLELNEVYYESPTALNDNQLQKALTILSE